MWTGEVITDHYFHSHTSPEQLDLCLALINRLFSERPLPASIRKEFCHWNKHVAVP